MPQMMLVNPRKRRKARPKRRKSTAVTRRRRRNPRRRSSPRRSVTRASARRVSRRRRRNPIKKAGIQQSVMSALTGAGGALTLDLAYSFLPIPDTLKTGTLQYIAKGAGAVAIGMIADKALGKKMGEQMGVGALTVVAHDAMRAALGKAVPTLNLGEYLDPTMGEYLDTGAYDTGAVDNSLGYVGAGMNPAEDAAMSEFAGTQY